MELLIKKACTRFAFGGICINNRFYALPHFEHILF